MNSSNLTGFILAMVSSAFIGSSFIIKKKGLRRASANGPRASQFQSSLSIFSLSFFFFFFNIYNIHAI